jgi:hypothetical protein
MSQESLENFDSQPIVEPQSAEKMIPQSKANEIIALRMREAAEKARRETLEQMQQPQAPQQIPVQQPQSSGYPQNFGGMQNEGGMDVNAIVDQALQNRIQEMQETAQRQQNEAAGQQVLDSYSTKLMGSPVYEQNKDLINSLHNLPHDKIAPIVFLANSVDNTADVMVDLAKNRMKMANLASLMQFDPDSAIQEIQKLSESIKINETAKQSQFPNEPMSQMRSSPHSMDNGGDMSVSALRRKLKSR